jgi:hypothetical protein
LPGWKGTAVTGNAPQETLYVLLSDEEAAGRVIVELDAFVRYNRQMTRQLVKLERQTFRRYPFLLRLGAISRRAKREKLQ